jgi:hypothetical protein
MPRTRFFVPLLLRLGAPPALVVVVGAAPVGGAALQAFAPQILRRLKGDLRRLTLGLALAEVRDFVLAAIVAGWPPAPWTSSSESCLSR